MNWYGLIIVFELAVVIGMLFFVNGTLSKIYERVDCGDCDD